jgi:thiosulfate dehydrogenase [quinone] large subunit
MSTNPITDYHFVYAVGTIALALTYAGSHLRPGTSVAQLPFVQRHRRII